MLTNLSLTLFVVSGRTLLGPKSVAMDRLDYRKAIGHWWKGQTLLSDVKVRYLDLPRLMHVASVASRYSMHAGVSVNGTLSSAGRCRATSRRSVDRPFTPTPPPSRTCRGRATDPRNCR